MEPLVVSSASLLIALVALAVTIWRTRRTYNDADVEELAEQVGRLARRARADTMRRVRAEKNNDSPDGALDITPPPELRGVQPVQGAIDPRDARSVKQQIREKLLTRH